MRDRPRQTPRSLRLWFLAAVLGALLAAWDANDAPDEPAAPALAPEDLEEVEEVEIIWNYEFPDAASDGAGAVPAP